jgi:hypothetical protein
MFLIHPPNPELAAQLVSQRIALLLQEAEGDRLAGQARAARQRHQPRHRRRGRGRRTVWGRRRQAVQGW